MNPLSAFHSACKAVIDARTSPAVRFAVNYAAAGLGITDPESCRVQCLYILNNITGWRGDVAKATRAEFKRLSDRKAWA